jgi:putative flippase GtrA
MKGEKRRFILFGGINSLLTNLALQLLLLIVPVALATMLSQLINMILGYFLYGNFVFRSSSFDGRSRFSFAIVSMFVWLLNWAGILVLVSAGLAKNTAALILIPLLPFASFFLQKYLVFIR